MNELKCFVKKIVSKKMWINLKKCKLFFPFYILCYYDSHRYYKYSACSSIDTSEKLIGKIIMHYHVIEKGLTMPDKRMGFGQDKVLALCNLCQEYINEYSVDDSQLAHAIGVLVEYKKMHDDASFSLSAVVLTAIESLLVIYNAPSSSQIDISKEDYFKYVKSDFLLFSNSRSSVRNYTNDNIPLDRLLNSIELAKKTPSACNRQAWRSYIYTDKAKMNEILEIQGGNRGFGHLGNKLIVVAAELGVFSGGDIGTEHNQAYIDGGMYAMNLLYALHYNEIACCILNCSNTKERDVKLRKVCKIKESEIFIAMIICGIPPTHFRIASSPRYECSKTNTIIC